MVKCEKCGKDTVLIHTYIRGLHNRNVYKCPKGHKITKRGKIISKKYW